MRVLLDTQLIYFGYEYLPGDSIELPEQEARRFIAKGLAMPCEQTPAVEAAVATASTETATTNYRPPLQRFGKHKGR